MRRLTLALTLFILTSAAWAQVQVTVGNINAAPGTKIVVPITISEGQNIAGLQFELGFDPTVLSVSGSDAVLEGELCGNHGIVAGVQEGSLKVALLSGSLASLKSGPGTVAQVIFDVAAGATVGATSTVTLSNVKACDAAGAITATTTVNGTITFGASASQPLAGQNRLIFPQIANGVVGQGNFYTVVILINQTQAPAFASVRFLKPDGSPFSVTLATGQSGAEFNVTVAAGGSTYLRTDGTGGLSTGYASVASTAPLGGTIMFGWRGGTGSAITEAGVGATTNQTDFSVPVMYTRNVTSTGMAIANSLTTGVAITVELKDTSGATVQTRTLDLPAGQQIARYVQESELFPSLASQASFLGTLHITAPSGVAVTAVKQAMQEGLITTFPIVLTK